MEAKVPFPTRTDVSGITRESANFVGGWQLGIEVRWGLNRFGFWIGLVFGFVWVWEFGFVWVWGFVGERGRTAVDFVLLSERERDPDKLELLGVLPDEPHLVQPHVGCVQLQTSELRAQGSKVPV